MKKYISGYKVIEANRAGDKKKKKTENQKGGAISKEEE